MAWHLEMARIIEAVRSAPPIFGLQPWDLVASGIWNTSILAVQT